MFAEPESAAKHTNKGLTLRSPRLPSAVVDVNLWLSSPGQRYMNPSVEPVISVSGQFPGLHCSLVTFWSTKLAITSQCAPQWVKAGISNETLQSPFYIQFGPRRTGQTFCGRAVTAGESVWTLGSTQPACLFQETWCISFPQKEKWRTHCSCDKAFHHKNSSGTIFLFPKL